MTAALDIKTREQFETDEIAAIEAALPGVFLFPVGSVTRAFVEGHSATAIWLQSNEQYLYNRERLATSVGSDVDSFLADFGLKRLPGVAASGNVQFASFTANTTRFIPAEVTNASIGATVSTTDGTVTYQVIPDLTNPLYSPSENGYVIPPSQGTVGSPADVLVQALTIGAIGNVAVNSITVINSPIVGVDTVNNAVAFTDGEDQQSDAQARQFFVDFINSLSKATVTAISFTIETFQEGIKFVLVENTNYDTDAEQLGYFYAVIDDGSYAPPPTLLGQIAAAVNLVRGATIRFDIKAVVPVAATITANIVLPLGYTNPDIITAAETALTNYIVTIPFGGTLFYTRIAQVIYNVLNTIAPNLIDEFNVNNVLLNGGTADLTVTFKQEIRPFSITVTTI